MHQMKRTIIWRFTVGRRSSVGWWWWWRSLLCFPPRIAVLRLLSFCAACHIWLVQSDGVAYSSYPCSVLFSCSSVFFSLQKVQKQRHTMKQQLIFLHHHHNHQNSTSTLHVRRNRAKYAYVGVFYTSYIYIYLSLSFFSESIYKKKTQGQKWPNAL